MSSFLDFNTDFIPYGRQHLLVILLTVAMAIGLPLFGKKFLNQTQNLWIGRCLAMLISGWVVLYVFILFCLGKFNHQTDLPLDICNLIGLLLPILMWKPSQKYFPFFYFYIMAGTTQPVFAPHLFNGFPNFVFLKFWILHSGLIVYILFISVTLDYKVKLKDIWPVFLGLQVYALFVFIINKIIGSNYIYLIEKPPTASVLDYFGPWPVYIFVADLIFLVLCFLVYLPYLKASKR
ncbi:TIGR02206 family membrane protein [uncultured Winogradskyella sp.]|uniref:YwaF family protein n=1 Tax=uncultured Winogradskyella sp. TaxID=395353 RepID=UPI003519803D